MQLALEEELVHRLICMQDPQVYPNEVLSPVLKAQCLMAPVNSCSYVSEVVTCSQLLLNGMLHILGAGLTFCLV